MLLDVVQIDVAVDVVKLFFVCRCLIINLFVVLLSNISFRLHSAYPKSLFYENLVFQHFYLPDEENKTLLLDRI